jgi:hypothetical protein
LAQNIAHGGYFLRRAWSTRHAIALQTSLGATPCWRPPAGDPPRRAALPAWECGCSPPPRRAGCSPALYSALPAWAQLPHSGSQPIFPADWGKYAQGGGQVPWGRAGWRAGGAGRGPPGAGRPPPARTGPRRPHPPTGGSGRRPAGPRTAGAPPRVDLRAQHLPYFRWHVMSVSFRQFPLFECTLRQVRPGLAGTQKEIKQSEQSKEGVKEAVR